MRPLLVGLVLSLGLLVTSARADDCPPGSIFRSEESYTWCEPTVCQNDDQCKSSEVCRQVPLCLQIGTLTPKATALSDAGKRLVATQRCAPDKTCPQTTVCNDMSRCLPKTDADKMGLLAASAPSSSASPDATASKKSCGCRAVGGDRTGAAAVAFPLGLGIVFLRRRARKVTVSG